MTGQLVSGSFLYSGGTGEANTKIEYPGSTNTYATVASSARLPYYTRGPNALVTGFEDSGATYTRIKYPKSADTWVWGINTAGAAAGYYENGSGDPAWGFVYAGGTYSRIKVPKSSETLIYAINTSGTVAGYYNTATGKEYGFLELGGTYTRLRFPGSIETNATAINVSGEVAGDYEKGPDDRTFGFVYSNGTYSTINIPDSLGTFVTGINASGDVTGYYVTNSTTYGFIATPQIRRRQRDAVGSRQRSGTLDLGDAARRLRRPRLRRLLQGKERPSGVFRLIIVGRSSAGKALQLFGATRLRSASVGQTNRTTAGV